MKQRALFEFTAPVAVGLMLLGACGTEAAPTKEPIRVGVLVTLTGAFAQLGQDGTDGVKSRPSRIRDSASVQSAGARRLLMPL